MYQVGCVSRQPVVCEAYWFAIDGLALTCELWYAPGCGLFCGKGA